MKRFGLIAMLLVALSVQGRDKNEELDRLAGFMTGSFSSKEQSEKEREFFDVRLQMARIWKDRPGEYWLYVEQAMVKALDKPYRQRVYKLESRADGKMISRVFELPGEAMKYAGAWKKDKPLADLAPENLVEKKGCAIVLTKKPEGHYAGSTEGKGCVSNLKGANYATSEVTIAADLLTSWDRGYDQAGTQVWGAVKGPYLFKKDKK